jgi:hypothetical protein
MDRGMGNQDKPSRTPCGLGRFNGATFMIQLCFCDAAFHTVAVLKDVFKALVSSIFQSRKIHLQILATSSNITTGVQNHMLEAIVIF